MHLRSKQWFECSQVLSVEPDIFYIGTIEIYTNTYEFEVLETRKVVVSC